MSSAPARNGARQRAASYAKRFAAKEACAKALGTGMSRGVFWRDMGVVNLPGGKPTMHLTNGAAKRLAEMLPAGHRAAIHLTITDDFPLAQAFVIIEALARRTTAIFLGLKRLPIPLPRTARAVKRWPTR